MIEQHNILKQSIRGGQITLHNLRMVTQVLKWLLLFHCLVFLAIVGVYLSFTTTFQQRQLFKVGAWAQVHAFLGSDVKIAVPYTKPLRRLPSQRVLTSPAIRRAMRDVQDSFVNSLWVASLTTVMGFLLSIMGLYLYGRHHSRHKRARGYPRVSPKALTTLVHQRQQASSLKIAGIPMLKDSECSHFLIHGTTGSGKSQLFYQFLDNIRAKGQRAIIYDKGCAFTERYYHPGKDILLNPLDRRCPHWELWSECS